MLAAIEALLARYAAAQAKDKENWGYVGDLGALNEKLGEAAILHYGRRLTTERKHGPRTGYASNLSGLVRESGRSP